MKILHLGLFFLICISLSAQDITLGVLYFESESLESEAVSAGDMQALATALSAMTISDLSKIQALRLVEREELNHIIEEQKLALSGLVNSDSAARAGELLGVRYLLTGQLVFTSPTVLISSRVLDTESGEIVASSSRNGPAEELFVLQEENLEALIRNWDIPLSRQESSMLSARDNLSLNVMIHFGKALKANDRGDYEKAVSYLKSAVELNPDFTLANKMLEEISLRFDSYLENRESLLPLEIRGMIDSLAEGDETVLQDLINRYMAYLMPLNIGVSFYGSWSSMDKSSKDYFFKESIAPSWVMIGLPREPENMEEVEYFLGKRIYIAQSLLEYLLSKNLPLDGYNSYMHPVETFTGYFLSAFSYAAQNPDWTLPPMISEEGEVVLEADAYNPMLLRYCDMFLQNFPYSAWSTTVAPMMPALLNNP